MSLTTRLLLYFQAALAMILIAFCTILYGFAHWYIHHEAQDRLDAATSTLIGSLDIEPDNVEWEPRDRDLVIGPGPLGGSIYWFLTDATGAKVDQSPLPGTADLVNEIGLDPNRPMQSSRWLVTHKWAVPPGTSEPDWVRERTGEEIEKGEHPALIFTVGVRTAPIQNTLRTLALALGGVSLLTWLVSLAIGRSVCRRALRPVTEMARAAREMNIDDRQTALPPAGAKGELEDLHSSLSDLLNRLQSALERERRFTAEASHQLRTPIGTILGQVEVALRKPRAAEEYERVLGIVQRQASQLSRSAEGLLFLARADTETQSPAFERLDLAQAIRDLATSLAEHPRHGDLVLEWPVESPFPILAHPSLLRELLFNLVDNAFKYSPPGTPVTLRLDREDRSIRLCVEDRGSGISTADHQRLFQPFFRSDEARRQGIVGTGLGLAIVARIARLFQATISVTSEPGHGTQFQLHFPSQESKEGMI
jgi:signal transduction histidine kinase